MSCLGHGGSLSKEDKNRELACSGSLAQEQAELHIHTHKSPGQRGMDKGSGWLLGGVTHCGSYRLSLTFYLTVHFTGTLRLSCSWCYIQGPVTASGHE